MSSPEGASPAQPACTTARTPARCTAAATISPNQSPWDGAMLPKPTKTGGGPACRNSTNSTGGSHLTGLAGHQYPLTPTFGGQSAGRGSTAGLKPWQVGQPSGGPPCIGAAVARAGGRPSRARSRGTISEYKELPRPSSLRPAARLPAGPRSPVSSLPGSGNSFVGTAGTR